MGIEEIAISDIVQLLDFAGTVLIAIIAIRTIERVTSDD